MKYLFKIAPLLIFRPLISFAADNHQHDESASSAGVEALSGELRGLQSREMLALQDGMMSIIPAYASGN